MRDEDAFVISTAPADLHKVKAALEAVGLKATQAELSWIPKSTVRVEGKDADALVKLLEALEELDDVQKVDANFDMDVSAMAQA